MDKVSQILAETARDLTKAYVAGTPLAPVEAEGAARIAAHFQPRLCSYCGDEAMSDSDLCKPCYRDVKGPFSFGEDE